ncbi:hypothetical protein [Nocardioides mangrovi]|uniref:VanZ family protein n=1 Tax=Nocardioides mangrovi TaxID=2874580 RepID=A0ABS7U791_9ACTN|nr:hypothetical protein [Nocardioides mangrovi]MBZ5736786.1 hypothetical protein [Nocardioides mangrovi]
MTDALVSTRPAPALVRTANVVAKLGLIMLLWVALSHPDLGHLRGKAAVARAISYPLMAFLVPAAWYLFWRDRAYPWLADLLITIPCFSDILGNRLNLYDTLRSFDDWMHFGNLALLTGGVILLTLPRSASLGACLERALAFGATAAIIWEVGEYLAFLRLYGDRFDAYGDTLGDLCTGTVGALVGALVVHRLSHTGRITDQPLIRDKSLIAV